MQKSLERSHLVFACYSDLNQGWNPNNYPYYLYLTLQLVRFACPATMGRTTLSGPYLKGMLLQFHMWSHTGTDMWKTLTGKKSGSYLTVTCWPTKLEKFHLNLSIDFTPLMIIFIKGSKKLLMWNAPSVLWKSKLLLIYFGSAPLSKAFGSTLNLLLIKRQSKLCISMNILALFCRLVSPLASYVVMLLWFSFLFFFFSKICFCIDFARFVSLLRVRMHFCKLCKRQIG